MAPWAELGAPAVPTAPYGDRRWRSVPARQSGSTHVGVLEPAARQKEQALPAAELVEPVEQSVPEVLEASGPVPLAAAVEDEAGTAAVAVGTTGPASGAAATAAAAAAGTGTEVECCYPTQQEPSSSSCPQSLGACARC
jgi:hypothetical protein